MTVRLSLIALMLPVAMAATAAEPNSPAGSPAPIEQGPPPSTSSQAAAATTPVHTAAPAQSQGPAQAPAEAASPTEAAKTSPVDAALGTVDIAQAAHSLGYTPRMRQDKLVYCKREAEIGTRLQHMSCYTSEEMTAVVQRSQNNKDSVSQIQRSEMYQSGGT